MLKKIFYVSEKVLKTYKNINSKILQMNRNEVIFPNLLGYLIRVKNGKNEAMIRVKKFHIGHKAGEFFFTRRFPVHKIKKKKK